MVMRGESYMTEAGTSAAATVPGLTWKPGTFVPFRLTRALRRDKEDTEKYLRTMDELKTKQSGNRSPQMTVLEARTDFLRSMQSPISTTPHRIPPPNY